ncbi:glycosyltransferase family 1 protein [soil metagenome]
MFLSPSGGGISRYLAEKQRFLGRRGIEHLVIAPVASMAGVTSAGLSVPAGFGYRVPMRMSPTEAALRRFAPDIIEIGDPYHLGWSALRAARAMGTPVVSFCHSDVAAMLDRLLGPWCARPARRYLRSLYSRCDRVLAPSQSVAAHLRSLGLDNIDIQPLGVDVDAFSPACRDEAWRRSLGLADDARIALYVGRFAPEKNLALLAEAIGQLDARHHLVAIGAGPRPPHGERVILRGFDGDTHAIATAMASADLLVHAGDQETFGLVALEAMACGTPVVARQRAGLAELVDDSVGAAVADGTAAAFAAAISATLERPRDVLGAAGRARAMAHAWPAIFEQMLTRYERLAGLPLRLAA